MLYEVARLSTDRGQSALSAPLLLRLFVCVVRERDVMSNVCVRAAGNG